jgi:hypothetical protein
MKTVDEAIASRLKEKRLARETYIRSREEEAKRRAAEWKEIARQAQQILSDCYELDLSDTTVIAYLDHEDDDGTGYYEIQVNLTGTPGEQCAYTDSIVIVRPGPVVDPESLLAATWSGFCGDNTIISGDTISTCEDLLDALIFAKYGTTDPIAESDF